MHTSTPKDSEFSVTEVFENFSTWLNKEFISDNLREQLNLANILIVPDEGFRDFQKPVFPIKTEELFTYLRNKLPHPGVIEICIEDEDYVELSLHSNLRRIGSFVVLVVVLPILLDILSSYIYDKVAKNEESQGINVSITVVNEKGVSKKFTFEGDAKDFNLIADKIRIMMKDE